MRADLQPFSQPSGYVGSPWSSPSRTASTTSIWSSHADSGRTTMFHHRRRRWHLYRLTRIFGRINRPPLQASSFYHAAGRPTMAKARQRMHVELARCLHFGVTELIWTRPIRHHRESTTPFSQTVCSISFSLISDYARALRLQRRHKLWCFELYLELPELRPGVPPSLGGEGCLRLAIGGVYKASSRPDLSRTILGFLSSCWMKLDETSELPNRLAWDPVCQGTLSQTRGNSPDSELHQTSRSGLAYHRP